jgi:thiol:disulfide interchange protein DsbD
MLMALASFNVAVAQEELDQAVRLSWRLEPAAAAPGTEAELVIIATLSPDWVVYSSDFKAEIGPQPARLSRGPGSTLELLGPLRSIEARRKRDASLGVEYGYFSGRAEWRQRVRLPADGAAPLAVLRGQACYEANGTCYLIRREINLTSARS